MNQSNPLGIMDRNLLEPSNPLGIMDRNLLEPSNPLGSLPFLVSARIASDPHVSIFSFILKQCPIAASDPRVSIFNLFKKIFFYETMSNCSQNCWIGFG